MTYEYIYFGADGANNPNDYGEVCVAREFGEEYRESSLCSEKQCEECWKRDLPDQKCRVCGCTWDHACKGGCHWVEKDLCSKCAETPKEEHMSCPICLYGKKESCTYTANNLSKPKLGEECPNFSYDCDLCKEEGFQNFGCLDCDLTEEEYYGE